ncbi:MAG: prolyl oligopeptidase family serine peptidase [Bacteroidia bacterium]
MILTALYPLAAQDTKRPLDHSIYDSWRSLTGLQTDTSGRWVGYERNPQRGDGELLLHDLDGGGQQRIARGGSLRFDAGGHFWVARVCPPFDSTRRAKIARKKGDDLPQDSLCIGLTGGDIRYRIARLKSVQVPPHGGDWLVWQAVPAPAAPAADSLAGDSSTLPPKQPRPRSSKKDVYPLTLLHPVSGAQRSFGDVQAYACSDSGHSLAFVQAWGDSIDSVRVQVLRLADSSLSLVFEGAGVVRRPVFDRSGSRLAFLLSADTAKVKVFDLYYWDGTTRRVVYDSTAGMVAGWSVSEHASPRFSASGSRLFMGIAPRPQAEPADTLPDDEKVRLDVWHWQDTRLQPQQLKELDQDRKQSYLAVWHIADQWLVPLADEIRHQVEPLLHGDADVAWSTSSRPYARSSSWDMPSLRDYYLVDVRSGAATPVLQQTRHSASVSPGGRFVVWFDAEAGTWWSYEAATGQRRDLTGKLRVAFYDEEHDMPMLPPAYGIAGWMPGDSAVLLQDRYDLWLVDLQRQTRPRNLTDGLGRKRSIRFSYQPTDREDPYVRLPLLLYGVNETSKQEGYYRLAQPGTQPQPLLVSDHHYSQLSRAGGRLFWRRESFDSYPDLWTGDLALAGAQRLSEANPQQAGYLWGHVEQVQWKAFDGKKLDGLFYRPENFDPQRRYPMLVYFYEKSSDRLHNYAFPSPSRSTINPAIYASNGYFVFIPDIAYDTGEPGEDAYNAIVSGTRHLIERYDFIDTAHIGLQGQSWGGYQVAHLITQTTLFAAAMAGAPVSNMTSAYGGIRWGTGYSRMFQYEKSQSRLGATLWEDRERYLRNSPLFYADRVQTPLLMMHNDNDGAVPWYQGIEFFTALRRLDKPVWMLVYNGEEHNLTRWPNRVDLSIRMQQFFDHYLQGAPAPLWMEQGVPATEKGRSLGYELPAPEADRK